MPRKVFTILAFIAGCLIAGTAGTCTVVLPTDPLTRPTITRQIGNRLVYIPNKSPSIHLQEGERISLRCPTGFKNPTSYSEVSVINDKCNSGRLLNSNYDVLVECTSLKWNLYETSMPFSWCPPPMESYAIAQPNGDSDHTILAEVCYNFEDMSVQSMHYGMSKNFSNYVNHLRFREYKPTTKIQNVADIFNSREITSQMYDNPKIKLWMNFSNYESQSLIQNIKLTGSYNQMGGLLDVAWWSGLRLGNWQLYEEALNQHIEAHGFDYDILAGISGTVSAPIYIESCHKNRTLVEMIDNTNHKMPLYVWHYLKSSRHESDDLVVIGVNSPFYEFYDEKEIVFCEDICSQRDWLQKAHSTFGYKTMGVIFCCSVDDVKASKRLNGFSQLMIQNVPPVTQYPPVQRIPDLLELNQNQHEYDDDTGNTDYFYHNSENENDY